MYTNNYKDAAHKEYERWIENTKNDKAIHDELLNMRDNDEEITDSFYRELSFGTSGMRGIIGPGTNRINEYVVRRTTQGLSDYLNKKYENPSVLIAYDSRKLSREFAMEAAAVLSGNNIKAYVFPHITPVSLLSYGITFLGCDMGIMITASHNPKIFNGYKVYNREGYQIVGSEPDAILEETEKNDFFSGIKKSEENIEFLSNETEQSFIKEAGKLILLKDKEILNCVKIVYTPLNGAGNSFVRQVLLNAGIENVIPVPEQEFPDENFTTCPYPNPEKISAFERGCAVLEANNADLVLATDPDCDRVGVMVSHNGTNVLLTGNQIGIAILDFLCHFKPVKEGQFIMRSIVTTPFVDKIAEKFNLKVYKTLTGFKYIGEKISALSKEGKEDSYYFGFEESTGYLASPFVRDKDGVSSALLVAQAAAWNKSLGRDLIDRIDMLYKEMGYCHDRTENYFFEGIEGEKQMTEIMGYFRNKVNEGTVIGKSVITSKTDYMLDTDLPKSDVLEYTTDKNDCFIIRPSGTEAKIKVYYFEKNEKDTIRKEIKEIIESFRI